MIAFGSKISISFNPIFLILILQSRIMQHQQKARKIRFSRAFIFLCRAVETLQLLRRLSPSLNRAAPCLQRD